MLLRVERLKDNSRRFHWTSSTVINREEAMKHLVFALALLGAAATSTRAQDAIPDLKGTWSGKGKSIVFGTHHHQPGTQTTPNPRACATSRRLHTVEGQEGRLLGGALLPGVANTKEPFAWAIASDNKTSSERTWMVISASRSSAPTAWRSATPTTARARADGSLRPVTPWIA